MRILLKFCILLVSGLIFVPSLLQGDNPDGDTDMIVFVGSAPDAQGNPSRALFRIKSDGTQRHQITTAGNLRSPSVSSVGKKIAYFRWPQIHVCDWDGSNDVSITPTAREHFRPSWSPDGTEIAFTTDRTNDGEIFLMRYDGSNQRNLTWRSLSSEMSPAWSPDGKEIVFISNRMGRFHLFLMDRYGRNQRAITDGTYTCREPSWGPDGRQIAFASDRDGSYDIFVIDRDGKNLHNITKTPGSWDGQPSWSADGKRITFVSTRDGSADIFVMDADGSNLKNITCKPTEDAYFPVWVPEQLSNKPLFVPVAEERGREGRPVTAVLTKTEFPRPRILFRKEEIPAIQARLKEEPYAEVWKKFLLDCQTYIDSSSEKSKKIEEDLKGIKENGKNGLSSFEAAYLLGFAYQTTGREEYGRRGAEYLSRVCNLVKKYHLDSSSPDILAEAFDWLYTAMDEEERRVTRDVLVSDTRSIFQGVRDSSLGLGVAAEESETASNIIWINSGSLGIRALSLAGEKGFCPEWLDGAVRMMQNVVERWFDETGAPSEGHSYFIWAGESFPVNRFLVSCIKNNLGDNIAGQNIKNWPAWMVLSAAHGVTQMPNIGDSEGGSPRVPLAYMHIYPDNPLLDLLWVKAGGSDIPLPDVHSLLWWRPVKKDVNPADYLPLSEIFPKAGYAAFRAGFEYNDPLMTFSAPKYSGHHHAEGGAFTLSGYGMDFAVEAGNGNPQPQAHNNVLVNGRGRAMPSIIPDKDFLQDFTRGSFASVIKADITEGFATLRYSHLDYSIPAPHYPVKKAVRYGVIIHENQGIPPYFLFYDDYERDGKVNRYEFLLTGQRDNRMLVLDDRKVVITRMYNGPYFSPEKHNTKGAGTVDFTFNVENSGKYYLWLYIKGGNNSYHISTNSKKYGGIASAEATRTKSWQWKPFTDRQGQPLSIELEKGICNLSFHLTGWHTGEFARMLFTPGEKYQPWTPESSDAPAGSIIITDSEIKSVGDGWVHHPATETVKTEPMAIFSFLDPEPVTFNESIYIYRTRHFGQQINRLPRITAVRETVNPRFLVMAYPLRVYMEKPLIESKKTGSLIIGRIEWKNGTDWILSTDREGLEGDNKIKTDARLAVIRRYKNGKTSFLIMDGSNLIFDRKILFKAREKKTKIVDMVQ